MSGEKSASGKPILADDPHLSLATPSIWYQTRLEMKGLNVSGVIFAGVPGVILGHNDKIAWGVTNTVLMCKIYILRREILIMKMNFCITINGRKLPL